MPLLTLDVPSVLYVSARRDLEWSLICCNCAAKAFRWYHNAARPTKIANTPITIPAVSPFDRLLLPPPPDAELVEAEEGGVDAAEVDVRDETVRKAGDDEVVVPAGEFILTLVVIAGVSEAVGRVSEVV